MLNILLPMQIARKGLHDQLQGWMKKQEQLRGNMAIISPATHLLHHGALLEMI
jgi:hypothetical protein